MPKRILYVAPIQRGSTAVQRMTALQQLGHVLLPFDTYPYFASGSRLARSAKWRLALGPAIGRLNEDLLRRGRDETYDWVWVDKGIWVHPETLLSLGGGGRALTVHYTPDPAFVFNRTRHFVRSVPLYDVLVTSKRYELDIYRRHGARRVLFSYQGYDPEIFRPYSVSDDEAKAIGSGVCFVGHCEKHYYRCIRAAAAETTNVAVWGRWHKRRLLHPWLRRVVRGGGIWERDYAKVLCCAKIGLGLLSRQAPDASTTRSFEIPACGTFLLAERTEEHQELFIEGTEAEFFGTEEEMREKIGYYLRSDADRARIAAAGRDRCVRGGYTYLERFRTILGRIEAE